MNTSLDKSLSTEEPLIKLSIGRRRLYFGILYLLFMSDFIARLGINSILPIIQKDLSLSDSQLGALTSIVLLAMAVFVIPISFLGERFSTKKAISISACVWGIGSLLSGISNNFHLLLASRFFVGTGNAAYAPLSNSMITSMYPTSHWGKKIGLYNTAMTLGGALGAVCFAKLASENGWHSTFFIIGTISMVLAISSLILPETKKHTSTTDSQKSHVNLKNALRHVLKNKALILTCLGAGIGILALQGISGWMSIFFVREMGMTVVQAANIIGITAIVAALAFPIGGTILDKWYQKDKRSRIFMPAICFLGCALCFAIGFQLKLVPMIILGQIVYVLGGTSFHTATQELVPSWFKSVSYGIYVLFIQFLGACGPFLAGRMSDAFGLKPSLLLIQLFWLVGICILLLASRYYLPSLTAAREQENLQQSTEKGFR